MGALDELNKGLEQLEKANLEDYSKRLRSLEIKQKDLETRLKPLLAILRYGRV